MFRLAHPVAACCSLLIVCHSAAAQAAEISDVDCVRLALARAPLVRVASLQVDAAAEQLRAARAAYAPRLFADAQYGKAYGYDVNVTDGGRTAAQVSLEATVFDGGARREQVGSAQQHLAEISGHALQRQADLVFQVRAAYFTALGRRSEAEVTQRGREALRDSILWLQAQQRRGTLPTDDVWRAQVAAATAETSQRLALSELRSNVDLLIVLTGQQLTEESLAAPSVLRPTSAAEIEASPTLAEARAAAAAAQHDVEAIRAENREKVTLGASAGVLGVEPDSALRRDQGGDFLVGLRFPLFDGGAVVARVAAALATQHAAEANVEVVRQTLATALAHAVVDATRAEADAATWRTAIPLASNRFELMRARYVGGGNVRLIEVLDALTQAVDTQVNLERSLLDYRIAVATQHQIVGDRTP